ncbi:MAG TPA: hypothetical protein VM888_07475 [Chitinophagaceae bacterium]|nr:hypothetical protein [Chitinophagaceae bacterium]
MIWIFNGVGGRFPSGVFSEKETAEIWIKKNMLTGVLTLYPVDQGNYDWAVATGVFTPKNEKEKSSVFIGSFSSASQEHYHYEDGELD